MDAHTRSLIEDIRAEVHKALAAHEAATPSIQHVRNADRMLGLLLARKADSATAAIHDALDAFSGKRPAQPIAVMLDAIGGRRS
jgi:hypothetical protein